MRIPRLLSSILLLGLAGFAPAHAASDFPFVPLPAKIAPSSVAYSEWEWDETPVFAAPEPRTVAGHVKSWYTSNSTAGFASPAAARAWYADTLKALGAQLVRAATPADKPWLSQRAALSAEVVKRTHANEPGLKFYDSYHLQQGEVNAWFTVVISDQPSNTWVQVVQEKPLVPGVHPMTSFPWLDWPDAMPPQSRCCEVENQAQGSLRVLDGSTLRTVNGHLLQRMFPSSALRWSPGAVRRQHGEALRLMGGIRVNERSPADPAWRQQQAGNLSAVLKSMKLPDGPPWSYDDYLVRTPFGAIWASVRLIDDGNTTQLLTLETVMPSPEIQAAVTPAVVAASLAQLGRLELFVDFAGGAADWPAGTEASVNSLVQWLQQHPREHLEIQGHTDLQGNPAALQALSLRRAQALQQQLLARGIDAARLAVRGFGGDQPLLNTPSAAGQPTRARLTVVVRTP